MSDINEVTRIPCGLTVDTYSSGEDVSIRLCLSWGWLYAQGLLC